MDRITIRNLEVFANHGVFPEETALGQKFVKQLGKIQWKGSSLGIQCSVGVCVCMHSRYTYQQLYTKTDQMLYRAKKTGKGRCCVCQLDCAENKRFEGELV